MRIPDWRRINLTDWGRGGRYGLAALGSAGLLSLAGWAWAQDHSIYWNESHSLPGYVYYSAPDMGLALGQEVAFHPPRSPLVVAHFGQHPVVFIKKMLGRPGEVIRRDANGTVTINGRFVGQIKPRTHWGEVLLPGPIGTIPQGCLYAGSTWPDGFDSRYAAVGLVCQERLIGAARRLL